MIQPRNISPRHIGWTLTGIALLITVAAPLAISQQRPNQREVRTKQSENGKIWSLHFTFKDPRILQVNVPGRGSRLCWYMWYQIINRTGKPRTFIPDFELVTNDFPGRYQDEVLPSVQEAIKKLEDPNRNYDMQNSVTIAAKPIPTSKLTDAVPRRITGVAIWDGSKKLPNGKDLADSVSFSIYVSGLSNGWVLVDPGDSKELPIVRRKTLQLNFRKIGDRFKPENREIQWISPNRWIYRPARIGFKKSIVSKSAKK